MSKVGEKKNNQKTHINQKIIVQPIEYTHPTIKSQNQKEESTKNLLKLNTAKEILKGRFTTMRKN